MSPEEPDSPESSYRAYEVDRNDHIVSFTPITAHSDDEAVEKTKAIPDGRVIELWNRDRLVIRLPPKD